MTDRGSNSPTPTQFPAPRLTAILDVEACAARGFDPIDTLRAFVAGGATFVQLRAKPLPGGAFLDLAGRAVELAHAAGARLIVNDRADVAALSGADGVHVGQDDLGPADARRLLGSAAIVGLSTHTTDQLERALDAPVSYVAIGPVFATATKATGYDAVGLTMVRRAAARTAARGLPLVAIGGMTLDHAPAVIDAGAASVAVIGDLLTGGDPERRVREYVRTLGV
ncbi:MAG TPA: thiamine phosphate synthase [Vicinamibacterales bacterium]|nr:thiamine phosphate synthase [Vicinamibacterales bacterium]